MTDHIARVREQAEREANRRIDELGGTGDPAIRRFLTHEFIDGAEWIASRLTREKIGEKYITNVWIH